jgi:hypothetical protein
MLRTQGLAYIPGNLAAEPGPLSRFLPPLEEGTVAAWLSQHVPPSSWVLDPFGFSPQLPVEAARAGYRVLVTVNNPVTHFLLETAANPPPESDFKAALAELAASKKGVEHLETHLKSLYLTRCENCGREIQAEAFLWRKGEEAPFARIYECPECGDSGERAATREDADRARNIAAADGLHRSRALERVAALDDSDRFHVQEALQHYLARPLYALSTIINRRDNLSLSPDRQRALNAMILVACDAANTLWGHPAERRRPKQLSTPNQFREHNVWGMLERGLELWMKEGASVPCVEWPGKIPGTAGICVYEGRLKELAAELRQEIPIRAVIGSIPRPNQAFWTLSALWAGWLWGRAAVDPYRAALRRRRYDWAWNATALYAAFSHLLELVALGTPLFGLLPEAEPAFLNSALTAISAAGFDLKGFALRTEHDPVQLVWERGERLRREAGRPELAGLQKELVAYLAERGEPASYLHVHAAGLQLLAESHALRQDEQEFDESLRATHAAIETALKQDARFIHLSTGEGIETGLWGVHETTDSESLTDHAEEVIVRFLQANPTCSQLELEAAVYGELRGLFTPSMGIVSAILHSYARQQGPSWTLRPEDTTASRQQDLRAIESIIDATGKRLKYKTRSQERWLLWDEDGSPKRAFTVRASARVANAMAQNPLPVEDCVLVLPGGRAALIDYKAQRDPAFAERLKQCRLAKYRLWRTLSEASILTRQTFEEQLASDPIERSHGQMIMF